MILDDWYAEFLLIFILIFLFVQTFFGTPPTDYGPVRCFQRECLA